MSKSTFSRKWIINIVAFLLDLIFSVGLGYIFIYSNSGIPVNVAESPKGENDKKAGQVITAVQSQSIKDNGVRINFPQFNTKQDATTQQQKSQKTTSIVAATFGDQIRLIDFFVTGINEKPELSFKSTARGMVFINPLFAGLPFEKRVNIFQAIEKDSKFQDLVKAVAASSSLLDDEVINLSTDIAINIAKDNNLFLSSQKTSYLPNITNPEITQGTNIFDHGQKKNPWQVVSNWFIPAVQAQSNELQKSRLEYTLTQQFPKDKLFFDVIPADKLDYPIWHGMKLDASDGTVKIVGTSPMVQQVIVVPKDKRKPYQYLLDDDSGAKKSDGDVVAEALLKPADLGIWDGSVIKTVTGGNQIEQVLTPKNGGNWQPGKYSVLISAGSELGNRNINGGEQSFSAMDLNLATLAIDIIGLVVSNDDEKSKTDNIDKIITVTDIMKVASLFIDCGKNLSLEFSSKDKDGYSIMNTLLSCVGNPEKLIKVGEILGLKIQEDEVESALKIFEFEGEVLEKTAKRIVKVIKAINVADKGIALSRIFWLGQYLNREIEEGLYIGEFSVVEKPYITISGQLDAAQIDVECRTDGKKGGGSEKYQALDVIIEKECWGDEKIGLFPHFSFRITNYSKNAIEVKIDEPSHLPDLLYPDEYRNYQTSEFESAKNRQDIIYAKRVSGRQHIKVYLKSYSPYNLAHEFTIACDRVAEIWGLYIRTECVPPGLRATYQNNTRHTISLGFVGSSDPPIVLRGKRPEDLRDGGSGTLESSSTKVNISLVSNP
ncbi:hypothetical protein A0J48_014440 [Sphaerospermopsis aphanizomenoides BCCUSP55]|uniref:hypothetical protein n=1 Tax=Sphaerospermopsis aphanizomenoides TaxID=459663 RepID=UPI001905288B|nr:hypothetical protein [Sphaerospermopsis aphanizomenoides]MBK1988721.1 hypothetical protein [Sphaerospermopsis aphanizomenoides BCCUSP55]